MRASKSQRKFLARVFQKFCYKKTSKTFIFEVEKSEEKNTYDFGNIWLFYDSSPSLKNIKWALILQATTSLAFFTNHNDHAPLLHFSQVETSEKFQESPLAKIEKKAHE